MSHHHKAFKGVVVALSAMLVASGFAGCASTPSGGGSTTTSTSAGGGAATDVVNLEFWDMAWGPSGVYDTKAKALVDAFNQANPGIHVNYTLNTWDNWYQTFAQAVASGTAPDVSTGGGFQPFGLQQDADAILPLNDLVQKWQSDGTAADFKPGTLDYYKDANGDYLGIPWGMDIRVWYARTDLLDQAGVQLPTTYDQLKADCDAVHKLGADTYGIADGGTPHWTFMQGIAYGAGMLDANGNPQLTTNPTEMSALQYIASMGQGGSGCINPSATTISQDDAISLFDQGKAAFVMDSPSFATHVSADTLKVTKVVPVMSDNAGNKNGLYFINGIMAYKQTKHPAEAEKFIEYWSSVGDQLILSGASAVSPRTSLDNKVQASADPLYKEAAATWGPPTAKPLYTQAATGSGVMNTVDGDPTMTDLERALFAGTPSVADAAATAQAKLQGFIDASK